MPLTPGTRLGPYEILGPLGAGGMGEVYRARDPRLGRDVAIKALPAEFARDPERLARFEREARLLASLSHPNIAGIHGLELVGDHRYLVLELVEGETLAARLSRGALPVDEALQVGAQVAAAVEAAHEAGVVHRDLKPGNVMLKPDGSVKVLDFGLAKGGSAGSASSDPNLSASPTLTQPATTVGVILGTAAYMSPEQARGKSVDRRTDIWSFGCVLYECLSGRQTFAGETVSDVIARILQTEPDWSALPADTPPRAMELIRRCLTKDVTLRLRDIGEARIALLRAHEPAPESLPAAPPKRDAYARLPWVISLIAVVVAIAAFALGRRPAMPPGAQEVSVVLPPGYRLGTSTGYHFTALSRDGRVLVYAARGAGSSALRVRRLDGRGDVGIPGTDDARDPFFSPDGEWVAFFNGKNLLKVSVHGGAPVPLAPAEQDRGGAWLDDGTIVFVPEATQPLLAIRKAGGAPVAVTKLDSSRKERTHRWPCALDGGPWVVFTVGLRGSPGDYDDADIDAVSVRTGERRHLVHGGRRAAWAPPNHLVFDREGTLYAVEIDPRNPRVTQEPVPVLDGIAGEGSSGAAFFDIARNGTMAWLPSDQSDIRREIGWFDRFGRWTPTQIPPGEYRHLALAPDGARALVLVGSGGGAGDIWLADLSTGGLRRLTYTHTSDLSAWLPGGSSFALTTTDSVGFKLVEVRRVDGAGGARTLFRIGPPILISSVTPDGGAVLYSDYGPANGRMYLVPVSPGNAPLVLPTDANEQVQEQAGVFSPNGQWLAYISNRTGREEVFIRRRDGTGARWQVTSRGGSGVRWGRDGRELFFVEDETLKRVTIATRGDELVIGQPEALFEVPASPIEPTYRDYAYDPKGDRFLFTRPPLGTELQREIALSIGWGARISELIRRRREQP